MTSNQTSSIRFTVEESVWFKKGQEVSDLIAMSLDPEISVQEHEDYISIRGALVLSGEYHPHAEEEEEQEIYSLRDTAIYRTVDEVTQNDGGVHSMRHRFPIDITIPTNRIRSLEEVYVLIESFDYEIPERGRLELKADLCISGIANERESSMAAQKEAAKEQEVQPAAEERTVEDTPEITSASQEAVNNEELASSFRQNVFESFRKAKYEPEKVEQKSEELKFPSFTTEVRKEAGSEEAEEDPVENRVEAVSAAVTEEVAVTERAEAEANEEIDAVSETVEAAVASGEVVNEQESEPELVERTVEAEVETVEAVAESDAEVEESEEEEETQIPVNIGVKKAAPQIGMKGRSEQEEQGWNPKSLYSPQQATYNTSGARESAEGTENQTEQHQRTQRSENALYLTKMLQSGDEDFSKLRLRIVQSGETLGTIAETYDISVNQIIRLNGLSDEVLQEGQILYIPEYAGVEK